MRRLGWILPFLLAACAVGPDYRRPDLAVGETYLRPDGSAGRGPRLATDLASMDRWWTRFGSTALDDLVGRALNGSPSLAAAQARAEGARDMARASAGALFPNADLSAGISRDHFNWITFGLPGHSPTFNLYTLGGTLSYALDLFGGTSRQVESDAARADGAGYRLAGARVMLAGNTVIQALTVAAAKAELDAAAARVAADSEILEIARRSEAAGRDTHAATMAAETRLATDRMNLPALHQASEAATNALAVLVGDLPAGWREPPLDILALSIPAELPLTLPSALLHQRPDILAAEADLHAAAAAVGVATANMLPHIELSAALLQATGTPSLFWQPVSTQSAAGAGLTAPLFRGGALWAERQAAEAEYRASLAEYRKTVLAAFAQIADILQSLSDDSEADRAAQAALDAASSELSMARASFAAGRLARAALAAAESREASARAAHIRVRARLCIDVVNLHVALGGGPSLIYAGDALRAFDQFSTG